MNTLPKHNFLEIIRTYPESIIGKQIIYENKPRTVQDVSICGRYLLLNRPHLPDMSVWVSADSVAENVVIDTDNFSVDVEKAKKLTAASLLGTLRGQSNLIEQKDLIVIQEIQKINHQIFELKSQIERIAGLR